MDWNREHASPSSPEARATPAGVRWLYRQIAGWNKRAWDDSRRGFDRASDRIIASYYQTLLIEAYEDGATPP